MESGFTLSKTSTETLRFNSARCIFSSLFSFLLVPANPSPLPFTSFVWLIVSSSSLVPLSLGDPFPSAARGPRNSCPAPHDVSLTRWDLS